MKAHLSHLLPHMFMYSLWILQGRRRKGRRIRTAVSCLVCLVQFAPPHHRSKEKFGFHFQYWNYRFLQPLNFLCYDLQTCCSRPWRKSPWNRRKNSRRGSGLSRCWRPWTRRPTESGPSWSRRCDVILSNTQFQSETHDLVNYSSYNEANKFHWVDASNRKVESSWICTFWSLLKSVLFFEEGFLEFRSLLKLKKDIFFVNFTFRTVLLPPKCWNFVKCPNEDRWQLDTALVQVDVRSWDLNFEDEIQCKLLSNINLTSLSIFQQILATEPGTKRPPPKTKPKEETAFTEEDFEKFEKEYFVGGKFW